jgi:ubiquitin carboxyl-terminal hydrolase 4/11/15
MRSPEPLDGADESDADGLEKAQAAIVTRMAEESSDEDSDFPKAGAKVRNILLRK